MLTRFGTLGSNVETLSTAHLGVYILCGGASSRMGRCKATIEVDGQMMLARILETVSTLQSPIFLVGKSKQKAVLSQYNTPWISDHTTTFHPLNGVVSALSHAKPLFENALFLPCDTPFISLDSIRKLLERVPSVAVDSAGQMHPLLLHVPVSWVDRANRYLENEASMKAFAEPSNLVELSHHCLRNLNNPSDLPSPIR